jgi:hypothetical protein
MSSEYQDLDGKDQRLKPQDHRVHEADRVDDVQR